MDPQIMSLMPYLSIGFFVLIAIIIIPLALRKSGKARKQANNFFPELAQRTGLQVSGDSLTGMYKGYQVSLTYKLSVNAISAYKTVATGKSNVYGRHTMFPALHVQVMSPAPFPTLAIYDPPSVWNTSQFLQDAVTGTEPNWPKMNVDGDQLKKGVNFYGLDEQVAHKAIQSAELKSLLSTWKYTDIRMEGNNLKLTLDNNNAPTTIGVQKMYTHSFPIQALDIAVAAAKAVQH